MWKNGQIQEKKEKVKIISEIKIKLQGTQERKGPNKKLIRDIEER